MKACLRLRQSPLFLVFGFVVSDNPSRADQRRRVVVSLQGGCPGGQAVVGAAAMLYNCAVFDKA